MNLFIILFYYFFNIFNSISVIIVHTRTLLAGMAQKNDGIHWRRMIDLFVPWKIAAFLALLKLYYSCT